MPIDKIGLKNISDYTYTVENGNVNEIISLEVKTVYLMSAITNITYIILKTQFKYRAKLKAFDFGNNIFK